MNADDAHKAYKDHQRHLPSAYLVQALREIASNKGQGYCRMSLPHTQYEPLAVSLRALGYAVSFNRRRRGGNIFIDWRHPCA
mgnify:FL=1